MSGTELPEPDRIEGAPHPRDTVRLIGQGAAEAAFLDAFTGGRMHHGWLITGPRGVGKATLAWSVARFLLTRPAAAEGAGLFGAAPAPDSLAVPADHPVARRMAAQSEPGLFVLRRGPNDKGNALSAEIRVDDVRRLKSFFALSSAEGGRRVVIVDTADEMNASAANALLKLLEEPPANATLLLVSHSPARLLPTIRSRCRELRLGPLGPAEMAEALAQAGQDDSQGAALAELSGGSVGEAIRLARNDGLALYADLVALLAGHPRLDRMRLLKFAESTAGRGAEGRFDLVLRLIELALARLARTGATGTPPPEAAAGEAALLTRLAPDAAAARLWAEAAQDLIARARQGRAVNLDPASLILDTVLRLDETAGRLAA
ncbi:DNA polymerase III subunit delta' [Rhodovulum sulfidophilum]|uniref:DNA polymerase III subunit delta n=1 Tax=Rhodovulum sulfidophilum TaxID=35806 RepID=A0ABS1RR48_RHOSU|nr:DNA polymerase III subunit delta' [Rhodovulum sulfidophilum]MBL3608398.1 DNA polymerase III subunit delta' [Rhodovulum sulfidophilum]MCE8457329.1 DNA polymerase III subunit delta' [Rhodovulum sulfidophilum]